MLDKYNNISTIIDNFIKEILTLPLNGSRHGNYYKT